TSCSGRLGTRSSSSWKRCGPTSDVRSSRMHSSSTRADVAGSAAGRDGVLSSGVSRVLVAAVGLPFVLGLVYLGGWWMTLLVLAIGTIALHEFYSMTRALRPLVLAGYVGLVLALIGAKAGGLEWMLGGF